MANSKAIYKEKSKQTFDEQASIYESTYNGRHAEKLYKQVIESVNRFKCKNILDIGCGTGIVLALLAKKEDISLSGVDLSAEMINIAKEKLMDRVELKVGDSEELPWADSTFDAIICTDSFHHYPEPEKVLKEMKRVLKANGNLIIGDPWAITPLRQIINLMLKYSKNGDYRIYSKKEISKLLLSSGFNSVNWNGVNSKSFIVTAESDK